MLPCACSVFILQKTEQKSGTRGNSRVCHWCFCYILTSFVGNCIQQVVGSISKYTNYLMNQPRNPVKKLDSKLHKQLIGWPKISNTARKIQQRWKSAKITTAKFKYAREHVLGHDWLNKITWNCARREKNSYFGERAEFRIPNLFFFYITKKQFFCQNLST